MSISNYNILYGITILVGITLMGLVLTWIVKYQDGFGWKSASKQFYWHPFLMVLSLVFLYSQSILVYRTGRYHTTKKILKYIHAGIHLLAFVCSVIGLQAVFDSHNRNNFANLYSIHSWIGLITVLIFSAQFLSGFIAFLYPGMNGEIRKYLLPHHVWYGKLVFIMAIITTVAGIQEVAGWNLLYSTLPPVSYVLNFMGLFSVLYGALTLHLLLKPEYKREPTPQD